MGALVRTQPCKTCGKPIGFVAGYRGPVNPDPVLVVAMPGAGVSSFVRANVGVVSARRATFDKFGTPEVGAVPAFVSHFSTCVTAHLHRKPREAAAKKPSPAPTQTRDLFPSAKPFTGGDPS